MRQPLNWFNATNHCDCDMSLQWFTVMLWSSANMQGDNLHCHKPLLPTTVTMHCDNPLQWCIGWIPAMTHCDNPLWWCSMNPCTAMIHCEDPLWWCTSMNPWDKIVLWCTATKHWIDALQWDDPLWWSTHCDDPLQWDFTSKHCNDTLLKALWGIAALNHGVGTGYCNKASNKARHCHRCI